MSHERLSRFAASSNIENLLQKIGVNLSTHHKKLLDEYRSLGYGREASIDRALAIEALQQVRITFPDADLNELGIQLPPSEETVYDQGIDFDQLLYNPEEYRDQLHATLSNQTVGIDHREIHTIAPEERYYINKTVKANEVFLDAWDQLREEQREGLEETSSQTQLYKSRVTDVLKQHPEVFSIPKLVEEVVVGAGFHMPDEYEFDGAEYMERGVSFEAQNELGDTVEVKMTSSGVYIHIEDGEGEINNCQKKSKALTDRIQRALAQHAGVMGGFGLVTQGAGFGHGQLQLDAKSQVIAPTPIRSKPVPPKTLKL